MAFDFNQLKQRFSKQGATQDPAATQQVQTATTAPKPAKTSPKVEALKRGFLDIKAVCEEGKIKLFAKQVVVVLLAFFGVRYLVGKINAQKEVVMDRISAIAIQQTHQDDYVANKDRLLRLEPLFPDIAKKNAKGVSSARSEAITSSNHYAKIAQQNSITHQTAEKAAENE